MPDDEATLRYATAKGYRYPKPGEEIKNTNWPLAFNVFDTLDREVDRFLGASASHGLAPGH